MCELFRRTPMLLWLLPTVVIIVCSSLWDKPLHLYKDTEIDFADTLRVFRVVVHDMPTERKKTHRYEVEVLPSRARAYLYINKDTARTMPSWGDTLLVRTRFRQECMLGDFDYGKYLRGNGIAATAFAGSRQWRLSGAGSEKAQQKMRRSPRWWRYRLTERYRELGFSGAELGTLTAMTLGSKEEMDTEVKRAFRHAGAAHVLAVSGLHTGILYAVLLFVASGFGYWYPMYEERNKRLIMSGFILTAMWLYAALTGWTPSVVRSVIIVSLMELARLWHRQSWSVNCLAAAAVFILCIRPSDLFSVSFQLSFAAVAGIIVLEPSIRKCLPAPETIKRREKLYKAFRYIRGLITVSLAAQFATLPLTLFYFHETSNWFMLTNIIVLPLAFLLVTGALAMLTIGWLPVMDDVLSWTVMQLTKAINGWVSLIDSLPGAVTEASATPVTIIALYAITVAFAIILKYVTQ